MRRLVARFDGWVARGDLTAADLGLFRILFAVTGIVTLGSFSWVNDYPDSLFDPPPGLMSVFTGFPPDEVTEGLEVGLMVALAFLALGFHTRAASVAVAALLLVGDGFSYSLGKIDHSALVLVTPVVLAVAGWGDARSIDSARRPDDRVRETPQWPMRFLALLMGLAFLSAAAPKLASGWLDPDTQAVQQTLFRQYFLNDRTELLARTFVDLDSKLFWEAVDWSAIGIEVVIVVAVVRWRLFRAVLALATLFHLGVWLMLNIAFAGNVLAYGAFARWSALPLPGARVGAGAGGLLSRWPWPAGVVAASGAVLWHELAPDAVAEWWVEGIVVVGALAGLWYLAAELRRLLSRSRTTSVSS